jgi:hypothetical protein
MFFELRQAVALGCGGVLWLINIIFVIFII